MSDVNGGRRAFLRGAYLSSEGRATEKARQKPLGPRPPWHRDLPLQENCIDCAHPCTAVCEPAILKLHPAEHELAGLPYLDFGINGCTFCKACIDACPIESDPGSSTLPEIGKAQLSRDRCIAWNEIICQSCSGRCDYHAISTSYQRNPEVNLDLCNGCGICVSSCPVDAISIIY